MLELLKKLCLADGIAGREAEVSQVIREKLATKNIEVTTDKYGNLFASLNKNPELKKVVIVAHMDEIGFIIKHITDDGFIYVQPIGSWSSQVVVGQKMTITSRKKNKKYRGVFGVTPRTGRSLAEVIPMKELYLDIGGRSREDIADLGIQVGDMVTPYSEFEELPNNLILGKALDDRLGCAALVELLCKLKSKEKLNVELTAIFSVQEEVGTRGSYVAAASCKNDEGIIIDVATAKDTPGADLYKNRCLGQGPGIVWYDKTAVSNVALCDRLLATANEINIPYQHDLFAGGGTDAGSIQLASGGIPTVGISMGVRNCHSAVSIASLLDLENTVQLIEAYLSQNEIEALVNE